MSESKKPSDLPEEFYDQNFFDKLNDSVDILETLAYDEEFYEFMQKNWVTRDHIFRSPGFSINEHFIPKEIANVIYLPSFSDLTNISANVFEYRNLENPDDIDWLVTVQFNLNDCTLVMSSDKNSTLIVANNDYGKDLEFEFESEFARTVLLGMLESQEDLSSWKLQEIHEELAFSNYTEPEAIARVMKYLSDFTGKGTKKMTTGVISRTGEKSIVAQRTGINTPSGNRIAVTLHTTQTNELQKDSAFEFMSAVHATGRNVGSVQIAAKRDLSTSIHDLEVDILSSSNETTLIDKNSDLSAYSDAMIAIASAIAQNIR